MNKESEIISIFNSYPDVVTVRELMSMLRVSRNQAYTLVKQGTVKSFTVGASIRIIKDSVIAYVLKQSA